MNGALISVISYSEAQRDIERKYLHLSEQNILKER